jgi:hypothetical protein
MERKSRLRTIGTVKTIEQARFLAHRLVMADVNFRTCGQIPRVTFRCELKDYCFARSLWEASRNLADEPLTSSSTAYDFRFLNFKGPVQ